MQGMIQERVAHLEVFKLCIEVTMLISFTCLVETDSVSVIFADNTNGGGFDRLASLEVPRSVLPTALTVNHSFHHHVDDLLRQFRKLWGRFVGCCRVDCQGEDEEWDDSDESSACHFLEELGGRSTLLDFLVKWYEFVWA